MTDSTVKAGSVRVVFSPSSPLLKILVVVLLTFSMVALAALTWVKLTVQSQTEAIAAEAAAVAAAAAPVAAVAPAPAAAPAAAADDVERPSDWYAVTAPMVGTFYTSPAPGEPPFVQVGDEVAANQTLCIVEAMKLMNEIAAEEMGTVREVCLEDATPVEFGTVLFYIEPHGAPAPAPETA